MFEGLAEIPKKLWENWGALIGVALVSWITDIIGGMIPNYGPGVGYAFQAVKMVAMMIAWDSKNLFSTGTGSTGSGY